MQTLHYIEPRRLEWRDTAIPTLQDDREILVRPIAASICDIDRPIIEGTSPFTGPFDIGHEGIAEVIDVGDAVTRFTPGDRVVRMLEPDGVLECLGGLKRHPGPDWEWSDLAFPREMLRSRAGKS